MHNFIFIFLSLIASSSMANCVEKWVSTKNSTPPNSKRNGVYYSSCNVKANGSNRIAVFLLNFKSPAPEGHRSIVLDAEYDCKKLRLRPLHFRFFEKPLGKGKLLNEVSTSDLKKNKWKDINSSSPHIILNRKFCSIKAENLQQVSPEEYSQLLGTRSTNLAN